MVKKKIIKKKSHSKKAKKVIKTVKRPIKRKANPLAHAREITVEKRLAENFIALQKVMVNLSVKFDTLSTQISKLLNLFEISAKALAEKEYAVKKETRDDTEILKRVDNLFQQNKVIAKGLTLLHERPPMQQKSFAPVMPRHIPIQTQRPPMQNTQQPQNPETKVQEEKNLGDYQKSISSQPPSNPQQFKKL
jgi:hypothetical protein